MKTAFAVFAPPVYKMAPAFVHGYKKRDAHTSNNIWNAHNKPSTVETCPVLNGGRILFFYFCTCPEAIYLFYSLFSRHDV